MKSYTINTGLSIAALPAGGLFIGLINPEHKPPHLVTLYNGKVWNLTLKKCYRSLPATHFLNKLQSKNLESLWINIPSPSPVTTETEIDRAYLQFLKVTPTVTCLSPATHYLSNLLNVSAIRHCNLIAELLEILNQHGLVGRTFFHGRSTLPQVVTIGGYSREDVSGIITKQTGELSIADRK